MSTTEVAVIGAGLNLLEAMALVDLSAPRDKEYKQVGEKDHVVGEYGEDLQRLDCVRYNLFSESQKIIDEVERLIDEHENLHMEGEVSQEICKANADQVSKLKVKAELVAFQHELVDDIMWRMFKLQFPETADKQSIGIRQGNKLVWTEKSPSNGMELLSPETKELMKSLGMGIKVVRL